MFDSPSVLRAMAVIGILGFLLLLKYLFEQLTGERKKLAQSRKQIKKYENGGFDGRDTKNTNSRITFVIEKLEQGNTDILHDNKYSFEEKAMASLHLKEKGLLMIAEEIENAASQEEISKILKRHYQTLDKDGKKELLPLMFSGDMKTKASPYVRQESSRRIVEKTYRTLVKSDGLVIQTLIYNYLEETPFSERLPVGKSK